MPLTAKGSSRPIISIGRYEFTRAGVKHKGGKSLAKEVGRTGQKRGANLKGLNRPESKRMYIK